LLFDRELVNVLSYFKLYHKRDSLCRPNRQNELDKMPLNGRKSSASYVRIRNRKFNGRNRISTLMLPALQYFRFGRRHVQFNKTRVHSVLINVPYNILSSKTKRSTSSPRYRLPTFSSKLIYNYFRFSARHTPPF